MDTQSPRFVRRFELFRAKAAQVALTTRLIAERVDVGDHVEPSFSGGAHQLVEPIEMGGTGRGGVRLEPGPHDHHAQMIGANLRHAVQVPGDVPDVPIVVAVAPTLGRHVVHAEPVAEQPARVVGRSRTARLGGRRSSQGGCTGRRMPPAVREHSKNSGRLARAGIANRSGWAWTTEQPWCVTRRASPLATGRGTR